MAVLNHESPDDIRQHLDNCSADLRLLSQNRLLNERSFIKFAKDRGIKVNGVLKGDPGKLNKCDCLSCDGNDDDGTSLLFHPFRIYPLQRLLNTYKCGTETTLSLGPDAFRWNQIADLAILLEPIYWPIVTGWHSRPASINEDEYDLRLKEYRIKAFQLIERLDPDEWQKLHEKLRLDAALMDKNGPLYLLLRFSKWSQRKKIKGQISGALWLRHMAETVRRAFEEIHKVQWAEEDQSFGFWRPSGRTVAYGSERPLDDTLQSPSRLAFHFGLFTGSVVRWYVEGDTEYFAILTAIEEPSKVGIELINLRGNIVSGKGNIAFKLTDGFTEDRALRRFSMVSFDIDVTDNIKAIRKHVKQKHIVGFIAAHKPDFEFANFTLKELIEIAARIDVTHGFSGDPVRNGNWLDISCGRKFENRYRDLSERKPPGLKGEEWGRAMAAYASEYPLRSDDQSERPFWREIRTALQSRTAHYDLQREHYEFDQDTFELIDRGK